MADDSIRARSMNAILVAAAMPATLRRRAGVSLADLGPVTAGIGRCFIAAFDVVLATMRNADLDVRERQRIETEWAALDRAARIRRQFRS